MRRWKISLTGAPRITLAQSTETIFVQSFSKSKPGPGNRPTKCDTMKIIYTDRYIFGGFNWNGNRLFFVIPCLRISFVPYEDSFSLVFGLGILFWEFVWTIEIEK